MLTPVEKIQRDRLDQILTCKAETRDENCWMKGLGCSHKASTWVREIQFDLKEEKANINHSALSSANYNGPIPGFCKGHIGTGPAQLAQTVYFSRSEMYWGFRPNRYFVIFTDGTKQGGPCVQIDPKQLEPIIVEEYM